MWCQTMSENKSRASTRRTALKQISSTTILVAGGLTGAASATGTSSDENSEIRRLKYYKHTNHKKVENGIEPPKRKPVYYTIPLSQWIKTQTALNGARKICEELSSSDVDTGDPKSNKSIKVGITNRVNDADVGVIVELTEDIDRPAEGKADGPEISKVKQSLPRNVSAEVSYGKKNRKTARKEKIPVKIAEVKRKENGTNDSYFDHTYRPVLGGCEMNDVVSEVQDGWTNATPAYDQDKAKHCWVTAGHCVDRTTGNSIYQNSTEANFIGDSTDYIPYGEGDAATINAYVDATWRIASEDTDSEEYDWDIVGIASNSRIQDMVAANELARFQGRRTGRDHCEVTDYFIADWDDNDGPTVKLDHDSEGGDSGGAYYELDSDGAYMIGVHAWGTGTKSNGNTMEYIENKLNISV